MTVYYNEFDPFAAAWLRELIAEGLIPAGDVDERSIKEVRGSDLHGYDQCHFFAGIGGWPYALRLAGWPDDRPVWTGSCPCQPFSAAGKRKGAADERHLWPDFFRLIAERKPPVVFGEQVASKDGRVWLAGVRADLEGVAYQFGAADLCAAGIGAPHIRQRLFWVADAGHGSGGNAGEFSGPSCTDEGAPSGQGRHGVNGAAAHSGPTIWLPCLDGKARRVEPGIFPLAHGVPNRMGTLRGAGNAIVPPLALEFVSAWLEIDVFR